MKLIPSLSTLKMAGISLFLLGLVSCSGAPDLVIPATVSDVAAKSTFRKARENDISSIRVVASYYERGVYGFPQSDREAANWYQKGAELGDVECQYRIGMAYFERRGRWPNAEDADKWLRRAAEQGHAGAKRIVNHPSMTVEEQMFPHATAKLRSMR